MRAILITLLLGLLVVVSTLAMYRACRARSGINPNDDAIVASATTSNNSSSSPQASTSATDKTLDLKAIPEANSNKSQSTYSRSTNLIMLRANSEVRERSFDELARNPTFGLELYALTSLRFGQSRIPAGGYRLRLVNAAEIWHLVFYQSGNSAPFASLPLAIRTIESDQDWQLDLVEEKNSGTITMTLGRTQLIGKIDFTANEIMAEAPPPSHKSQQSKKAVIRKE